MDTALTPKSLLAQLGIGTLVGTGCGCLGWIFMALLDQAEAARALHPQLLWALPLLGLALGGIYHRVGRPVARGNNLIIDALCDGGPQLPRRMMPLGLFGTVAVHLCGGSVGQEGTAMQLGAAWGDVAYHRLGVAIGSRRGFLSAGVAGGFAAVFGTPVAGAMFALEFCVPGQLTLALMPCVTAAALVGDGVARGLGIAHPAWPQLTALALQPHIALAWAVFAGAMAAATALFVFLTEKIRHTTTLWLPTLPWRMALGGAGTVALTHFLGTTIYLGGGMDYVHLILAAETPPAGAFLAKMAMTALCLGTGFVGGEVTPLFFMGATLGHVLATWLGLPVLWGAAVGMGAMLSGATKMPLTWALLVAELVGAAVLPHALWVYILAAVWTGRWRIYSGQRPAAKP